MAEERLRKMQEEAARRQAEIDAKRAKELAERRGRGRRGAEVVEEEEEGTGEAGASSQGEAGARNGVEAGAGGGAAGGLGRGDRVIEREGVGLAGLRAAEGQGGAVAGTTRVPVSGNGDEEGGLIVPAKRAQKVVKEGKGRGTPGSASASGPPNPKSTAPSSAAPSTAAAGEGSGMSHLPPCHRPLYRLHLVPHPPHTRLPVCLDLQRPRLACGRSCSVCCGPSRASGQRRRARGLAPGRAPRRPLLVRRGTAAHGSTTSTATEAAWI